MLSARLRAKSRSHCRVGPDMRRPSTTIALTCALSVGMGSSFSFAAEAVAVAGSSAAVASAQPSTTAPSERDSAVDLSKTQVAVSDAGTVEMHVNDASLLEVLRLLSLRSQKNIIASKDVDGRVSANLYNVTIHEALDAILQSNGYVYREKGNFIYVYTARQAEELDRAQRKMGTEVFHLYYTPGVNAANMIKPVLSSDAQVAVTTAAQSGIDVSDTGTGDTGGNSHATEDMLVVTDYTDNLEKARDVLRELDRRPQEILVEATILAATLQDNNALGVDFSVMGGVNFSQFLSTAVADDHQCRGRDASELDQQRRRWPVRRGADVVYEQPSARRASRRSVEQQHQHVRSSAGVSYQHDRAGKPEGVVAGQTKRLRPTSGGAMATRPRPSPRRPRRRPCSS